MRALITPGKLKGTITVPSSKSVVHRAVICASLCKDPTEIELIGMSDDIIATKDAMNSLGADIRETENGIIVNPIKKVNKNCQINVGESGSTLRFLLPVSSSLGADASFVREGRLSSRPLAPLDHVMREHGAEIKENGKTVICSGRIDGNYFEIDGNVSSQNISGLMLSLPNLGGGRIKIVGNAESEGYIKITARVMKQFGITVNMENEIITVEGEYSSPGRFIAEGDWSSASFWYGARYLGSDIEIKGLSDDTEQKDAVIKSLGGMLGTEFSVKNIPDAAPIISAVASLYDGKTVLTDCGRLRLKESDRIASTVNMINVLGGNAEATDDKIVIIGGGTLKGGVVDSFGDHRIAMSAAILSTASDEKVIITQAECTNKSYPGFWDDFKHLGGKVEFMGD